MFYLPSEDFLCLILTGLLFTSHSPFGGRDRSMIEKHTLRKVCHVPFDQLLCKTHELRNESRLALMSGMIYSVE